MDKERLEALLKQLQERLHNPLQLRAFLCATMVLIGYGAIYTPLSGRIAETAAALKTERDRLNLARDVENLRSQHKSFKDRLSEKPDPNEWLQYVLSGIRQLPLKLIKLDPRPLEDVGPYKGLVLQIEVEGSFQGAHEFLTWLEANERLFRVDFVNIAPARQGNSNGLVLMQLTLVGLMG